MKYRLLSTTLALLIFIPSLTFSADHKMVIQVNSNDPLVHRMAISNARSLVKQGDVDVEMVVFGPGVALLNASGKSADKIESLMSESGVIISVCEGTLDYIAQNNNGQEPEIIDGVTRVPTGAFRIMELQEQGYAYLRP